MLAVGLMAGVAPPAEAATFNYLPTPVDVTPGVAGAWTDVDVSAYLPVGATGVIVQWVYLTAGADMNYGVRKKGSTDNWAFDSEAKNGSQGWLMTGVDAARVFQVFTESTAVKTYLVGYTMAGVTFFTNRIDKSTATTGSWVDVSIAADTGADTAIGAIFHVDCQAGSSVGYGLRMKGSTDNRLQTLRANQMNLGLVGVDPSETAQQQIAATTIDLFLVGYVTSGAVFFKNALDKSTATTGSYQDVDITSDVGAGVANGAFVEIQPSDGTRRNTAIRPNGSSYDYYAEVSHQFALVGLDAGDIFEQKIELTTMDLYLTGYSLAGGGNFRVKSGYYQGDASNGRFIDVGFQPDLVIITSDSTNANVGTTFPSGHTAVLRTSTMVGNVSKAAYVYNFHPLVDRITSLDPTGFTVGHPPNHSAPNDNPNDPYHCVNHSGVGYYWTAFEAAPGQMVVGSYTGNGAATQNVTGLGFTPDYTIVLPDVGGTSPVHRFAAMPVDYSFDFDGGSQCPVGCPRSPGIRSELANGFQAGTYINANATTYHYVAFTQTPGRIRVGMYTGDKSDDRKITGLGFTPEFVTVANGPTPVPNYSALFKPASTGTAIDYTVMYVAYSSGAQGPDMIQALEADGFEVGTDDMVNGWLEPVYYAAFGPHFGGLRYRSAGTNAANLNVGARTVTISGNTATFSGAMPANVGVGDVLQYQVPPAGPYYLAFISGRTSSTVYTVTSADGGVPQAAAAGTAVGVYRAYTSLSRWQTQDENDTLDDTVEDFDTSRDLVAADVAMLVACYNDGPMNDTVSIANTWLTGPNNYIRIFTPVAGFQVGASQRHNGVAGSGFRLTPAIDGASTGRYAIVNINTGYVRIEGIEIDGTGVVNSQYVRGINVQFGLSGVGDIRIDSSIIHDLHTTAAGWTSEGSMGIIGLQQALNTGPPLTITNNFIYDITNTTTQGHIAGMHIGSRTTSYVYNNTVYNIYHYGNGVTGGPAWGIYAKAWPNGTGNAVVIATNNYVGLVLAPFDPGGKDECLGVMENSTLTQSYNVSSDNTATGTGSQINKTAYATYFQSIVNGSENLHLTAASSGAAMFNAAGTDLSASFPHDIDGQVRTVAWDIGADEFDGTTAVRLMSFGATAGDGSVLLEWRTGSELQNLGFYLYRGASANGPWSRLTPALIPGLGSSAVGRAYSFRDSGLTNGVRYYYRLEDVDASSKVTSHGPVWAVPQAAVAADDEADPRGPRRGTRRGQAEDACPASVRAAYASATGGDASASLPCTRHGEPEAVSLAEVERDARSVTLELRTGGFYAVHEPAGTVWAFVPGFDFPQDESAGALPLRRTLVDAVVGRKVQLAGVRATDLARFPGLVPSRLGKAEMELGWDGTARALRRGGHGASRLAAGELVELLPSVFQGEAKSAVVELRPLRYDERRRQLVLARTLRVRLVFAGREPGERGQLARGRRRAPRVEPTGEVLARLFTTSRGLHAVSFEQLFASQRRGLPVSQLALLRQGAPVAFHVEPDGDSFGPGARLYFFADAVAASTAYSAETAYELVHSGDGRTMPFRSAAPAGLPLAAGSTATATFETNRFYQPGLLDAPDPWLWEALAQGVTRSIPLALDGMDAASPAAARLDVFLQGASESGLATDHHLSVSLNGACVGEARFAGKRPHRLSLDLPSAVLRDGPNELTLTSVPDTGVSSLVFLDRVELAYPQRSLSRGGRFEGVFGESGAASLLTEEPPVALLDTAPLADGGDPVWLTGAALGPGVASFQAEAGGRYLVVSASGLLAPRVAAAGTSSLRSTANRADYLLIAPQAFLAAARPLLDRRADQGLQTRAVAFEEIAAEFGHGQPSAEAIRDFIAFAFHSWAAPSPRYVLLLGDSNYDPRNFIGASPASPLPGLYTKTSYLWTVADPLLAAVNGEDALPDLAIGRLPAANVEEARRLVDKLVAWEESGQALAGPVTLVADDPDLGGDFEANVADIAQSFFADRSTEILRIRELGVATRSHVQRSLDAGLAWLSYVGHGGAAVWASENVWNSWDAASLQAQSRQPLLFTMNCLNGYFVAPSFDSLAESLVKPEGRGAIAAFSPSGLSLDAPAHQYHRSLTAELTSGRHQRLGDALLAAQAEYAASGLMPELLEVYHLFGDPAMPLR